MAGRGGGVHGQGAAVTRDEAAEDVLAAKPAIHPISFIILPPRC